MQGKTGPVIFLLILWIVSGCAGKTEVPGRPPPPPPSLVRLDEGSFPLFTDDIGFRNLELAVGRSLQYYERFRGDRTFSFGKDRFTVAELRESLFEFLQILRTSSSEKEFQDRIDKTFLVYRATGRDRQGSVLFTGYYEPILEGNWFPTDRFRCPVYGKPGDHVVIHLGMFHERYRGIHLVGRVEQGEVVPYYTREEIESGQSLAGRDLEILWVSDPVALFFLHIQGSGMVEMPDGTTVHITFAHTNGRPYRSIGKRLIELERIAREEASLQSIRRYLAENPAEMEEVLNYDESYVFFRIARGAIGSLGVPVTADRTIATDGRLFPKGALAFIRARKPVVDDGGNILEWVPFSRFVLNQDAGGAIKGPGRVDLFCGNGSYAEMMAGHLKEQGELFFLIKRKE